AQRRRPFDRGYRPRDVAGENDEVGVIVGRRERALAKMQVGEDVELHCGLPNRRGLGAMDANPPDAIGSLITIPWTRRRPRRESMIVARYGRSRPAHEK